MLNLIAALVIATAPVRIVDGDTIDVGDQRIRLANIDTPEVWPGQYKCQAELEAGLAASARLEELIIQGGVISYEGSRIDKYGRLVAHVYIDGKDIGEIMIAEGFAVRWEGHRHNWC